MCSLLSGIQPEETTSQPYGHLIVEDLLDPAISLQLIEEFPSVETIARGYLIGSNLRYSYPAKCAVSNPELNPLWREFIQYHVSQAFLDDFIRVFGQQVIATYPFFEERFGRFDQLKAGIRGIDTFSTADVLLDAQICVNTPVLNTPSSVRTGHVDLPNKLFFGLYYLRHPNDDSTGGDLELYEFKDSKKVFRETFVADEYLVKSNTITYQQNCLILGINSIDALHGVTVRSVTPHPRLFVNLVGEVKDSLFDLKPYQIPKTWSERVNESKQQVKQLLRSLKS